MSTVAPVQPWEPLDIPIDNPADLEAMVTAAEGLIDQAKWRALNIRAARVHALAMAARDAVEQLTEYEAKASLTDWQGEQAMSTLAYRVEQIAMLIRQPRRQFTAYQRRRASLEVHNTTGEGNVQS